MKLSRTEAIAIQESFAENILIDIDSALYKKLSRFTRRKPKMRKIDKSKLITNDERIQKLHTNWTLSLLLFIVAAITAYILTV